MDQLAQGIKDLKGHRITGRNLEIHLELIINVPGELHAVRMEILTANTIAQSTAPS